jgi:hypothetical protein
VQRQKWLWIVFGLLFSSILACTLARTKDGSVLPRSEITPANTSDWVAYPGRNVRIGAPKEAWSQIPFDQAAAALTWNELRETDPSVANLFFDLTRGINNDFYKLILMKNDGTATLTITGESLLPNMSLATVIQQTRQSLIDQGLQPHNQRSVTLPVGEATRWEIKMSPPGSQIINHQLQYIVEVNNQIYYLIFTAQEPDFAAYAPVFEAMALTFWVG